MQPHSITDSALCGCGCGSPVKPGNRFLLGHSLRRYGLDSYRPATERLWEKVNKHGPIPGHCPELGPCWVWTGYTVGGGYGRLHGERTGKSVLAHRLAYELTYGPIPDGHNVCHKCDNPRCVRPEHLFLGEQTENVQDCIKKRRHRFPTGEKAHSAKLSEDDVREARRLFSLGGVTKKALAQKFGVCNSEMGNILRGKKWRHVV